MSQGPGITLELPETRTGLWEGPGGVCCALGCGLESRGDDPPALGSSRIPTIPATPPQPHWSRATRLSRLGRA